MPNHRLIFNKGQKFGEWTVIGPGGKNKHGNRLTLCQCSCGTKKEVLSSVLKRGGSKSCGCLGIKLAKDRLTKHGYARHELYPSWNVMMQRCYNPKQKSYKRYGARGIKVCERWHSFENFLEDMGKRKKGKTIERINNFGNYEPGNCKWASRTAQANNRRTNRVLSVHGETKTLAQWARKVGVSSSVILTRINRGWPVEKAVLTPTLKKWSFRHANF